LFEKIGSSKEGEAEREILREKKLKSGLPGPKNIKQAKSYHKQFNKKGSESYQKSKFAKID
jgi:hypothetical protein